MSQKPVYEYRSKLGIFEDEASILIEGDTFKYGFDKKSGLISRLEVSGDDFQRVRAIKPMTRTITK